MHILYVTPNFAPEVTAEANRALAIVNTWIAADAHVTVLTTAPRDPDGRIIAGHKNRLWHRQTVLGSDILRVPSLGQRNASFTAIAGLQAGRLPKPDIVVATVPQTTTAALGHWLAHRLQVPLVLDLLDEAKALESRVGRLILRRTKSSAAHIITTTAAAAQSGPPQTTAARTTSLPPATDLTLYDQPVYPIEFRRLHGLTGAFVAGYVGPLDESCDLATLLAAASLTRDDPNISWLLAGNGPASQALAAQKATLALNHLAIAPLRSREEQPMLWSAVDAAVVPLRSDQTGPIPTLALNAMAMRRPLVISATAAAQHIIDHASAGFTATPGNAAELAGYVRRLAADPALAQNAGANARAYVMAHHDQHQQALVMLDCIKAAARSPA